MVYLSMAVERFDLISYTRPKLRLHVAFKPVPKPVSVELAWEPQV